MENNGENQDSDKGDQAETLGIQWRIISFI